jgi:hypothetical protein
LNDVFCFIVPYNEDISPAFTFKNSMDQSIPAVSVICRAVVEPGVSGAALCYVPEYQSAALALLLKIQM